MSKMSKPTMLNTEGTTQVSEWSNVSDTTKKLILPRNYTKVTVIMESLW